MRLIKVQRWAVVGSVVAVALGAGPALFSHEVRYDPIVALTVLMAIAIIWTAALATDNLTEFRKATEAEYTPVINTELSRTYEGRRHHMTVHLSNIGRALRRALRRRCGGRSPILSRGFLTV